jgi:hypothetical protein
MCLHLPNVAKILGLPVFQIQVFPVHIAVALLENDSAAGADGTSSNRGSLLASIVNKVHYVVWECF